MKSTLKKIGISVILLLCSFVIKAQKKDSTLAILDNKKETQKILNYNWSQAKQRDSILVIYNNKFYSLSDFDLANVISNNSSFKIINERDSIDKMILKNIKSLIIIENKIDIKKIK